MTTERYTPVLDHGFVVLRNMAGPTRRPDQPFDADDTDPANAARMSFDQTDSGRTREQDLKLAEYLMKNWHTSPFEMVEIWLEMKMPIFVARQWVRHRTASLNEVSGRYVELPAEWYIPRLADVELATPSKKQGGKTIDMSNELEVRKARDYLTRLNVNCEYSYDNYKAAIADGIAMEQARLHLHLNHYTHWLWKQNLHNMMHLLAQRKHPHAQQEIRWYAQAIDEHIRAVLPHSMSLFDEYRMRA